MTHHNGCLRVLCAIKPGWSVTLAVLANRVGLSETGASARFRQLRKPPYNCVMECFKMRDGWYYYAKHIPAKTRRMLVDV